MKDLLIGFKKKEFLVILLAVVMLASVSGLSLMSISEQGGNARVVNYIGIVRGATQKLIKEEMYNNPDDALITRLDGIIDGLITGEGDNNLIALPDEAFQENMQLITVSWTELKEEIMLVRDGKDPAHLFELSQDYFVLANDTVSKAEEYSEGRVAQSRTIILGVDIAFAILLIVGFIYVLRQQALQRKAEQFKALALLDTLTGIPNRMRCEQICKQVEEDKPVYNIAVYMFDMNNLKVVNDKFGHQSGDKLITSFATILANWAEQSGGFAGRFGGDEFLAVFHDIDLAVAEQKLQTLYADIDAYNNEQKSEFDKLSFAAGYSVNNLALVSMEVMIIDADRAMYENKRQMKTMD
jgi:diguanylate cyclase (GGDEF)-like protein